MRAVQIVGTMQANTFVDERMKVLYALSFMHGGTAQVWAANETMAVITGTTQMQTLDIFLESVEKTFRDLDWAQMARAQLHELKMTPSTTAEDYMAQFEMLVGRTGSNNAALKDIYFRGLPNSILQKIFAQVTLPNGLAAWKMVVRNLDHLHRARALSMPTPCPCPCPVHACALSMPVPVHARTLSMPAPCPCPCPVYAHAFTVHVMGVGQCTH